MKPVSFYMSGRDNNFNLMRVMAALFIAYYHCYFMALGPQFTNEFYTGLYMSSQIVLNFFFIASGFLIAGSFERRGDLVSYFIARGLRLLPGVFVLSILLAFVMGPLVTEANFVDYFSSLKTWSYVPITTLLDPDARLPGVFTTNVNPHEIDEALWTLRYEVICYIGLAIIGVLGFIKPGRWFLIFVSSITLLYLAITFLSDLREIDAVDHLLHFGMSFLIGTTFYIYRDKLPLSLIIAIPLGLLAFGSYWLWGRIHGEPLILIASAYIVFWLAFVPGGVLRDYNRLGDYSYGIYIYHFPIQQILMSVSSAFTVTGLYLTSLPFTILMALLSWYAVERPSMGQLHSLTAALKSLMKRSAKHGDQTEI
jgi:peptidoglycan/LPS O-acetylase OafA/YrhL